jgi:hypothetical protein
MWAYWQTIFTEIGRVPSKVCHLVLNYLLNHYQFSPMSIAFCLGVDELCYHWCITILTGVEH